jgi:methionyl aminopeptidase
VSLDVVWISPSHQTHSYHGDLNATYPVGPIDDDSRRVVDAARDSMNAAIDACKPGMLFKDIGGIIEPLAKSRECTVNRTYCGHGIRGTFAFKIFSLDLLK